MKQKIVILSFGLISLFLGLIAGAILWVILQLINFGTSFIWGTLPQNIFGDGGASFLYYLIICTLGGLLIGLFQSKNGILPDETEEVLGTIKKTGKYPYNNLKNIAIAAILPLVFGGVLGPEAGLVGIIAGLCFWVTDNLKYRGKKLVKFFGKDLIEALSETSTAVVLGVIFQAPLFGLVNNLEPDSKKESYSKKILAKKHRIFIYIMGILGGFLAIFLLGKLLEMFGISGSSGIPRFSAVPYFSIENLIYVVPLIIVGLIFALIYIFSDKITRKIAQKFAKNRVISCVIAGVCLAIVGYFVPFVMFSGEHELEVLMENWGSLSAVLLLVVAGVKLIMLNVCVNFGWRGGGIFPIIFSGVALGYAMALIFGIDGVFCIAISLAAMYGYISKKPATTAALLLLCFPVSYLAPIIITAFIVSKIPSIKKREDKKLIEATE